MLAQALQITQTVMHKGTPMEAGWKPALCFKGRKYMLAVVVDYPIRVWKKPIAEFAHAKPLLHRGAPYAVTRFVKKLKEMVPTHGITAAAERLLLHALETKETTELDEEAYKDEENAVKLIGENPNPVPEAEAEETSTETPAEETDTNTAPDATEETDMATKKKRVRKTAAKKAATNGAPSAAKKKIPNANGAPGRAAKFNCVELTATGRGDDLGMHKESNRTKVFLLIKEARGGEIGVPALLEKAKAEHKFSRGQVLGCVGKLLASKYLKGSMK